MGVFVIISPQLNNTKLEAEIKKQYANDYYKIYDNQWLICAGGTSKVLSQKLNINEDNGTGPGIVFSIANYWGRANPEIWEWLKEKMEKVCD